MNKAIFLNRDDDIKNLMGLLPYISDGLGILQGFGYKIILVSNQPGVAKGALEEIDLFIANSNLKELFNDFNLRLDGFYYCPHHPEGIITRYSISCKCRKPLPGLYFQASQEFNINLGESWMIGDNLKDIEPAIRAGCKTLLLNMGNEEEWSIDKNQLPDYITYDFKETAEFIITSSRVGRFMSA